MKKILLLLFLGFTHHFSFANESAVVLQYHNISTQTPASTSVSPEIFIKHLDWLNENDFNIINLTTLVDHLKNKEPFSTNKTVAITFDDANRSVCEIAWPILKKRNIPFTVFINTQPINDGYSSQCTWQQLQKMNESELFTPANHSHQHLNMIENFHNLNFEDWKSKMIDEIKTAQSILKEKLNTNNLLFAYPYGEYNDELAKLTEQLGFTSFAQNSGAVGFDSDLKSLMRFAISTRYSNLETLKDKINSLAFPATMTLLNNNPIKLESSSNPPKLILNNIDSSKIPSLHSINCFNSNGDAIDAIIENNSLLVQAKSKLYKGRHRYTCTSPSPFKGRYYWMSHQWLIE